MRHNLVVCSLLLAVILLSSSIEVFGREDPERGSGRGRHEGGGSQDWERQPGRSSRGDDYKHRGQEKGQEHEHQVEGSNPYVFQDKHFSSIFQTEHGRIRELQRFSERSELLSGIDNYRLTILEADPQTFIIPNHFDAEAVFFVVQGKGAISLIRADTEKRESFNIKEGDIVRIPSGTPLYLINRDNNEKLVIAKLLQPVFTPGHFEPFFGAGGENPESFYTAFSTEILEAAFNTKRENLETVLAGQKKEEGVIIKASQEQIKALSQHEKSGIWPFGSGESKGTVNIFEHQKHSNQYGKLFQVSADDFRELEDVDIQVAFLNLTRNAMVGPTYSSKATKISLVLEGEGYLEMACPHLSSQSGGQHGGQRGRSSSRSEQSYQKVSTRLTEGTVMVIPAAHPYVAVASGSQNLQVVSFEINAKNSWNYDLAGKGNVVSQFEDEAKELAFGVSSKEVDAVFEGQEQEVFFPGPGHQQQEEHGGRAYE